MRSPVVEKPGIGLALVFLGEELWALEAAMAGFGCAALTAGVAHSVTIFGAGSVCADDAFGEGHPGASELLV
jgi:hypothetical protein